MKCWLILCTAFVSIATSSSQQFVYPDRPRWPRQESTASCTTPNRYQGTCINIRQCPILLDMLKNSRTKPGVIEFLQSSRCSNVRTSDVCCPNSQARTTDPIENNSNEEEYSNFMTPPQCGKSFINQQTRIVGGQPAELGAWPWMALLGYRTALKAGPFFQCGGALVSESHIITAAHCISPAKYKLTVVRLGENEIDNNNDGASPLDMPVASAIAHPEYQFSTKFNDIGIVKLEQPVRFTRHIQPICLPKPPEMRSRSFAKYFPFVAGWGSISSSGPSSAKLLQVQVPVVDNGACHNAYKTKGASIIDRQLCAGYTTGGKDACQGDSGGPLMLPNGTTYYLIGVVSYGYKCAEPGYPGIYSRVTSYLDWISKNMN